jgi:ribosomal protein S27AE
MSIDLYGSPSTANGSVCEMTDHFIKLSCVNCGGDLEVYDDMERFACGHCGAGMEVQRRGGAIVLRVVTEAARKAQDDADKTALTELTLRRLKEEAETLSKRRGDMLTGRIDRKKWGLIVGIALLAMGFVLVRFGHSFVLGLSLLLAGIITISYVRRNDKKVLADVREVQTKIDVLNGRIEDHVAR